MATLREAVDLIVRCLQEKHPQHSYGEQCARELEQLIIQSYGESKIYVPKPGSRKDPERAEAMREAAKKLPTHVVGARFGVSRQLVHYHLKRKGKNPPA